MTVTPVASILPASLFAPYRPLPHVHDEMLSGDGTMRDHWSDFLQHLRGLDREEIARRWRSAQRQLADEGVIFNPHDVVGAIPRPWILDPIPTLIASSEWKWIESGLQQRAQLWDLVLADLMGPQRLIRDRILPPALLFGHPLYQPSYHGLQAADQRHVMLAAAELARSPDGRWWVTADRTRAPLGMGYALENRIVTARVFPDAFRTCHVQRLASFFRGLQESLRRTAPRHSENPRIVLWTKGPQSPAYFEDSYLARYLGFTLVEGGDLAVRDRRLMLKTLGGALPVEVLFRRIEDADCDPVELRPDSPFGVPGLLETIRSRQVSVVNAPGSGLLESPAFLAFLPALCRTLLDEELRIPSVATWWCGDPRVQSHVLAHLDDLLVREAFRVKPMPPVCPATLTARERAEVVDAIRARPENYVACERVERSATPVWTDQGPQPWRFALRTFTVAQGDEWRVLPGGLARVSPDSLVLEHAISSGERSQDVWVLADGPVDETTLLSAGGRSVALRRTSAELPSRVADNLFWLGRYLERADGTARLLRTLIVELLEAVEPAGGAIPALLRVLAEQGQIEPGYVVADLALRLPRIEATLSDSILDRHEPRSLRSVIDESVRLASMLRERISPDAWRLIHQVDTRCQLPADRRVGGLNELLDMLEPLVTLFSAFAGLVHESITRTQGWRFLDLGRRIERAGQTALVLRVTLGSPVADERPLLEALLNAMDSIMTYRTRYLAAVQPAAALDLLLSDESNPRSIGFQVARLVDHIEQLPRDPNQAARGPEQLAALALQNMVRLADVHVLAADLESGERTALRKLLLRATDQLQRLSDLVTSKYLIHAGLPRHFASQRRRL